MSDTSSLPFWRRKSLDEMTNEEWESLCDGCGRCCLHKVLDEDTEEIVWTSVACDLLDCESCKCGDYPNRSVKVPDCVQLTPEGVRELPWLPPSCAYMLVAAGEDLYEWHPLKSGDPDSVHKAGMSVRGRINAVESDVPPERLELYAVRWPGLKPAR